MIEKVILLEILHLHSHFEESFSRYIMYIIIEALIGTQVVQAMCVCFLPIHSGHQVRWTYQPGSHRRKVTQDF